MRYNFLKSTISGCALNWFRQNLKQLYVKVFFTFVYKKDSDVEGSKRKTFRIAVVHKKGASWRVDFF
jgi:hypothetical protein